MSEKLKKIADEIDVNVKLYGDRLRENNARGMEAVESTIKELEKAYAAQSQLELFQRCAKAENPVLEAIIQFEYPIIVHRRHSIEGTQVGFKVVSATKPIDLVAFCEYCKKPTGWQYKVERLNCLMCMRVNAGLGRSEAEIKRLEGMYYQSEFARKVEMTGCIPTSNTQLVSLLQQVIDAIIFIPGSKNPQMNAVRCGKKDVFFLLGTYTKYDKKNKHCLAVARTRDLHTYILDVLNCIVTHGTYDTTGYKVITTLSAAINQGEEKAKEEKAKDDKKDDAEEKPAQDETAQDDADEEKADEEKADEDTPA